VDGGLGYLSSLPSHRVRSSLTSKPAMVGIMSASRHKKGQPKWLAFVHLSYNKKRLDFAGYLV